LSLPQASAAPARGPPGPGPPCARRCGRRRTTRCAGAGPGRGSRVSRWSSARWSVPGRRGARRPTGALDAAREVTAVGVSQVAEFFPSLPVTGRTEVTSPARALLEISAQASLLVMGSRGRGSVLAGLLGSVAFTVAGSTQCPLVVVNEGAGSTVAVPTGVSSWGRMAPGPQGAPWSSPRTTPCVTRPPSKSFAARERSLYRFLLRSCCANQPRRFHRAEATLETTHPRLPVTTRVVEGVPERSLVDASAGAGLMVVGSRGRGAFKAMGCVCSHQRSHLPCGGRRGRQSVITDADRRPGALLRHGRNTEGTVTEVDDDRLP
jgi:nucleotide-binding universal stress UspA family protein